jgi:hypothetical protein
VVRRSKIMFCWGFPAEVRQVSANVSIVWRGFAEFVQTFLLIAVLILDAGLPTFAQSIREIQNMLIWTGHYDGLVNGNMSAATRNAIRAFQSQVGGRQDGTLSDSQIDQLRQRSAAKMQAAGFRSVNDKRTGIEIGLPLRLLEGSEPVRWGTTWSTTAISVDTLRFRDGRSLGSLYSTLRSAVPGRTIDYQHYDNGWFALEGQDRDGTRFYVRASTCGRDICGFSVAYPAGRKSDIFPIVIAMSNSFNPQDLAPPLPQPPIGGGPSPQPPPPPRPAGGGHDACDVFPTLC